MPIGTTTTTANPMENLVAEFTDNDRTCVAYAFWADDRWIEVNACAEADDETEGEALTTLLIDRARDKFDAQIGTDAP